MYHDCRPNTPIFQVKDKKEGRAPSVQPMFLLVNPPEQPIDAPQTNAPAPMRISISKPNPLPRMSVPNKPACRASAMAAPTRSTANGYSART